MKVKTLKSLVLYNYRFIFAYLVIFLFAGYFLFWRLGSLPRGLSEVELLSAAQSASMSAFFEQPLYPLHSLLQWLSLQVFDPGTISIRLPSVILAGGTVLLLYTVLKKWFGKVMALLSSAIFLSADWFLFIGRQGTGVIEFSFWFIVAIFALMKLIEKKPNWVVLLSLSLSILLFVPFGPYVALTTAICFFACKMFRSRASGARFAVKLLSAFIPVIAVFTVGWLTYLNIDFLRQIFGIVEIPSAYNYFKNTVLNSSGVFMIWPDNNPLIGPSGVFLIRFFELLFMLFGLVMLWVTRVNRLNIVVIANAVVLGLVSGLSLDVRGGSLLLIPAAIFMTAGLRHFVHRWQRTFPKNPYARIALYIPLIILFSTAVLLHFQSYFVLWPHQTATNRAYRQDFTLLQNELQKPGTCALSSVPSHYKELLTDTSCDIVPANQTSTAERIISSKPIKAEATQLILTDPLQKDSARWFVYQQ